MIESVPKPRLVRTKMPIWSYLEKRMGGAVKAGRKKDIPMYLIASPVMMHYPPPGMENVPISVLYNGMNPSGSAGTHMLSQGKTEEIPWLVRMLEKSHPSLYGAIGMYHNGKSTLSDSLGKHMYHDFARLSYNGFVLREKGTFGIKYHMDERQCESIVDFWSRD
jgi:hypothetical protein